MSKKKPKSQANSIFETVSYIHIKDRKLLLARSRGKKAFYMAGGKKENDENNIQALVREIKEELSIDLDPKSIISYGAFQAQAYGKDEGIFVRLNCFLGKHVGNPKANEEVEEFRYFTIDEYFSMEETAPAVRLVFEDLKKKDLID